MDDTLRDLRAVRMRHINVTVRQAPGAAKDGIAVGQRDGALVIALTCDGACSYVVLKDRADDLAHLIADAILDANRAQAPSLGTVQ